jgi:hypothetical protein
MNHFIQAQSSSDRAIWQLRVFGSVGGLLMGLVGIAWQEQNARQQSAEWIQEKEQVQKILNQEVFATQGLASPLTSITDLRLRLQFLSDRHIERQNLSEVQSLLMQARVHAGTSMVQALEWQQGKMVLEGQVALPQDLAALHQDLLTFAYWQDPPALPQIQWVAPKAQSVPHGPSDVGPHRIPPVIPLYAFRMHAQLKSAVKTDNTKGEGR